jgi:hypothetical protein
MHYEEPITAVETEADAEELFMDLVMENQYEFCSKQMHEYGLTMAECKNKEWIWLSNWEYEMMPVCNLI